MKGACSDKRNAWNKGGRPKKVKSKNDEEEYKFHDQTKVKEKKDSGAPKKPQTAYFIFMNKRRPEVKNDNNTLSFNNLTKKLTEMWKELSDGERKIYEDLAAEDKDRYLTEMKVLGMPGRSNETADLILLVQCMGTRGLEEE